MAKSDQCSRAAGHYAWTIEMMVSSLSDYLRSLVLCEATKSKDHCDRLDLLERNYGDNLDEEVDKARKGYFVACEGEKPDWDRPKKLVETSDKLRRERLAAKGKK